MSERFIPPLLFPETGSWHASVIYWANDVLYLVHLTPNGPTTGDCVGDLSREQAAFIMQKSARLDDPYDVILAAQAMVGRLTTTA